MSTHDIVTLDGPAMIGQRCTSDCVNTSANCFGVICHHWSSQWQHRGCTEGVGWGSAVNCKTSQCTSHIAAIFHKRYHSLHHAPRNYHHTRVLYRPHYILITPPLGTPHTTHTSQHPHPLSDLKVILCPLCIVLPSPLTHSLQHTHTPQPGNPAVQ